jgi:hypothetical protein
LAIAKAFLLEKVRKEVFGWQITIKQIAHSVVKVCYQIDFIGLEIKNIPIIKDYRYVKIVRLKII